MTGGAGADGLALSVHGPAGVVDLVVPAGASILDVARAYSEQAGLAAAPLLYTRLGDRLSPDVALSRAGVGSGDLLVAATTLHRENPASSGSASVRVGTTGPSRLPMLWCAVAAATAVLAGWFAAHAASPELSQVAAALLAAAAAIGVVPVGRLAAHRVVVAPVFAAAAAFAVAWDPHPDRLPTVLGVSALVAAVVAALGRSLGGEMEEELRVWIWVGVGLFLVTAAAALLGFAAQVVWGLLLLASMLAARFVPGFAVEVPDHLLIDLDRLAVTAWSARERPTGRRGRAVVPRAAVAAVAARGTRIVTAAGVAILAVAGLSAPLLLATATLPVDRVGARCLVFFCGGGLLLAARSYRHTAARVLLRTAGLVCGSVLALAVLPGASGEAGAAVATGAIGTALLMVVVAVATGRGWRSAWWSRRAEVAEALCGSAAVATLLVAAGVFRSLWESVHLDV